MLINQTRLSWRATSLLGLGLIASLYVLLTYTNAHSFDFSTSKAHSILSTDYAPKITAFWKEVAIALEAARPQCPPVNVTKVPVSEYDRDWKPLLKKERPDRLTLSLEDEVELMKKHRKMRLAARQLGPSLPVGKETGIVTTVGLKLFPVLLVSLRMLRRTGCTLPVQVFLGDQAEYQEVASICQQVLPSLNARCLVVSDIYSEANLVAPEHFQFKILSIFFSSFRHVLFLDADAFPVHDPTPLLTSAPYTTHGLVTWPGLFTNVASAHFYHIAGLPVPPVERETESGVLLLDKEHHRASLIMMMYYNYYGPDYYYPLQAQGGPGQGDKETFNTAAMAVNAPGPFYGVKTPIHALGAHVDGQFIFAGAAQADPMQDYTYDPPPPTHLLPKYEWATDDDIGVEDVEKAKARAFFVHTLSDWTKLNPTKLLREGGLAYSSDQKWHRMWGEQKSMIKVFGFDAEQRMWECVGEEACRTDEEACGDVKRYFKKVFGMDLPL